MSFKELKSISKFDSLGNNHVIVHKNKDNTDIMLNSLNDRSNVNIGIASAITSLARVFMSQFKNNNDLTLFYTDTDSIFTDLDPDKINGLFNSNEIVGTKLGQLKLEYRIDNNKKISDPLVVIRI